MLVPEKFIGWSKLIPLEVINCVPDVATNEIPAPPADTVIPVFKVRFP